MGLFSDIYNTVAKFFRPQEESEASKSVATNRLKLVLMQDRTNLTPRILEQMRGELIELLSKYVELDKELLELNFEQEGSQVALMLSIPVIRAKDEEEIEAAIKASKANEVIDEAASEQDETSQNSEESGDEPCETNKKEVNEINEEQNIQEKTESNEIVSSTGRIIKKKKVSAPEEMTGSVKNEEGSNDQKVEISTEQ